MVQKFLYILDISVDSNLQMKPSHDLVNCHD